MDPINGTLNDFQAVREGARKFHKAEIGDVDPHACFADWLVKVWQGDEKGIEATYGACRNIDGRHPVTKAALSESTSGATGGYLVPTSIRYDLMKDVAEEAIFRPRCLVVPMDTSSVHLSLPDAQTTPAAAGTTPFLGGIVLGFKPEAATRPETEPQWRRVTLKAWELTGYALASNNLLNDGGKPLESVLRRLFARSIAFYEDYFCLQGNGVGQPMGIVNSPASVAQSRQTPNSFTVQDVGALSSDLFPSSWPYACFLMSPTVWAKVVILNTTGYQINQPARMKEGQGPHFVLNGQPGYVTEKLPALGTKGDVCLVDPRLYVIGDRESTEVMVSRDEPTAWKQNQSVFRIIHRFDGQPWFGGTTKLQDTTTTVGAFAVLQT